MKTEEGNQLIALFMEKKKQGEYGFWITDGSYTQYYRTQDLRYHSSWDWLMPVVEKINTMAIDNYGEPGVYIKPNICLIGENEHNPSQMATIANHPKLIEMVWTAITSFIQWYNSELHKEEQK